MLDFFFLLLDLGWSLRLYLAAFADCTAASGLDVLRGREFWTRRKEGETAVRAVRSRVVGDVRARHDGQYIGDAIVCSLPGSVIYQRC